MRERLVDELDRHSHDTLKHSQFGDLALLLHPEAQLRKYEIVVILIFWILLAGAGLRYLSDLALPGLLAPMWLNVLLVSVNVVLISYVFLPWSSMLVTRLKARIFRHAR